MKLTTKQKEVVKVIRIQGDAIMHFVRADYYETLCRKPVNTSTARSLIKNGILACSKGSVEIITYELTEAGRTIDIN